MNALKHGRRAALKIQVPGEDSVAFLKRLELWRQGNEPRTQEEYYLLHQNVMTSFQLDAIQKAAFARVSEQLANAERFELDAVHELGKRLLGDRCGAAPLYGIPPEMFPEFKTSWPGTPVDPDDPVVLVRELESTGTGCRWLIARWEELNGRLGQAPSYWQAYERFMAVRLLGKQPLEAAIDRNVAEIYLASFGIDQKQPGNAWSDFKVELTADAHEQFVQRIRRRWSDIVGIEEKAKCRQILTDLVARNLEQLKAKLAVHDALRQRNSRTERGHPER